MSSNIPSVLKKICEKKQQEVAIIYDSGLADKYKSEAQPSDRDFAAAISKPGMNLIAEFKRASPSKGDIRPGVEPEGIVQLYEESGASAISVLTDGHFKGELAYLRRVQNAVSIPLLRKDFIIDPAQIYEARAYGADAILIIAAILDPNQIQEYIDIGATLGMDSLVESHDENELEKAIQGKAQIFGINNRNLHDFSTDRNTTLRLLKHIPEGYPIVTESAIFTYDHVRELSSPRVNAMLIGEAIMSAELNPTLKDMRKKIAELLGKSD